MHHAARPDSRAGDANAGIHCVVPHEGRVLDRRTAMLDEQTRPAEGLVVMKNAILDGRCKGVIIDGGMVLSVIASKHAVAQSWSSRYALVGSACSSGTVRVLGTVCSRIGSSGAGHLAYLHCRALIVRQGAVAGIRVPTLNRERIEDYACSTGIRISNDVQTIIRGICPWIAVIL